MAFETVSETIINSFVSSESSLILLATLIASQPSTDSSSYTTGIDFETTTEIICRVTILFQ